MRTGAARLDEIAAVTFTENAATTMKLRLRERLERARADLGFARPRSGGARTAALEVLERAQVSTIHALCAALLGERPLECGVPPGFRVADDAEMDILFAEAWDEWLTERLVAGDATLMAAVESGIPLEADGWGERTSLRGLARTLVDQRDLRPLVAESAVDAARLAARPAGAGGAGARAADRGAATATRSAARLGALVAFAEAARIASRARPWPRTCGRCWPSSAATSGTRRTGRRRRRSRRGAPSRPGPRRPPAPGRRPAAPPCTAGS